MANARCKLYAVCPHESTQVKDAASTGNGNYQASERGSTRSGDIIPFREASITGISMPSSHHQRYEYQVGKIGGFVCANIGRVSYGTRIPIDVV